MTAKTANNRYPLFLCTTAPNDADLVAALSPNAETVPIPYGDCIFTGINDSGKKVHVLVERKHVGDMAQCIIGGRYMSQLQTAHAAGFDTLVLIIEDRYAMDYETGLLTTPGWMAFSGKDGKGKAGWVPVKPNIAFQRFDQFLTELSLFIGVVVKHTENVKGTANVIRSLYNLVQVPPSKHTSLRTMYNHTDAQVLLTKPSFNRRVARELDGIGWDKSGVIAASFNSVHDMCHASVKDWQKLNGIGKPLAESVSKELNGGVLPEQPKPIAPRRKVKTTKTVKSKTRTSKTPAKSAVDLSEVPF